MTPHQEFKFLVSNFTNDPHQLPKGIVIAYAKRNPIAIITPDRGVGEEFGRVLSIATESNPAPKDAETEPCNSEEEAAARSRTEAGLEADGTKKTGEGATSGLEREVDLSHIEDADLSRDVLSVLRKHA